MNKLQQLIKKTKCSVCIDINGHRDYCQTINEYIEPEDKEDISDEVWVKMVQLDTCVRLQVYPDTPIGSYTIYHYDVDTAIDIALNED